MKSDRVGELPEAINESLCEDIMPPSGEDALESNGEGLRWVLPPTGRIPSFRRLAPWRLLGCWSADFTPTLDTKMIIPHLVKCGHRKLFDRGSARRTFTGTKRTARIGRGQARVSLTFLRETGSNSSGGEIDERSLRAATRSTARWRSYAVRRFERHMIPCPEPGGQIICATRRTIEFSFSECDDPGGHLSNSGSLPHA